MLNDLQLKKNPLMEITCNETEFARRQPSMMADDMHISKKKVLRQTLERQTLERLDP